MKTKTFKIQFSLRTQLHPIVEGTMDVEAIDEWEAISKVKKSVTEQFTLPPRYLERYEVVPWRRQRRKNWQSGWCRN